MSVNMIRRQHLESFILSGRTVKSTGVCSGNKVTLSLLHHPIHPPHLHPSPLYPLRILIRERKRAIAQCPN